MSYKETISEMVKKSGLTLRQIADRCVKDYNVKIDPSYISKLQTGQTPASDEINTALAKVCGGDPEDLIYEGYMEKAPDMIKILVSNMANYFRDSAKMALPLQISDDMSDILAKQIDCMPDREFIKFFLSEDMEMPLLDGNTFRVKDNDNNDANIILNPIFGVKMQDDSMAPIIPEGAQITFENPENISNGDIVVAVMPDKSYLIRRYIPIDDKIILTAESKAFEAQIYNHDSITIAGKVKLITIEI